MEEAFAHWIDRKLERLGRGAPHRREPLAVEASHRRFYRLHGADGSLVAMSSPPALENNAQFVALARLFARHGIGVPELVAADVTRGFFLMTDLGEVHFADVYRDSRRYGGPQAVLPAAIATLIRLQQVHDPGIPPYTRQRFEDELGIYEEWFLGRLLGERADPAPQAVFETLLAAAGRQPVCCVHRDFHSRNLLKRSDGSVGVVDFQDALMGPATYDLASLLRDCYYVFPEREVSRWRDAYLAQTPLPVDRDTFPRDLDFTALQRQLKAVGIFARLHLRDGRDSHLPHILPVLERIRDLAGRYPETAALAEHASTVLEPARTRLENAA
jgi:hypothetical protein